MNTGMGAVYRGIKREETTAAAVKYFNEKVVEINGQFLQVKINLAKGYLTAKDAEMFASVLEQQLKQLLLANKEYLPQDTKYQGSLKSLKSELQSMASNNVQSLDDIPEDIDELDISNDGSEFLPD